MNLIRTIAKKIGMDGAIAYSSAVRIFQAFSGVISIFFIATFLTGEEQGFYYTSGSILAIRVFFELGFTGIMTQYATLIEAMEADGSLSAEIIVDETLNFAPKLSSKVLPDGKIVSPEIDDMFPFLEREEYESNKLR